MSCAGLVSSELPELLGICDRVLVVREGAIAGELDETEMSEVLKSGLSAALESGERPLLARRREITPMHARGPAHALRQAQAAGAEMVRLRSRRLGCHEPEQPSAGGC